MNADRDDRDGGGSGGLAVLVVAGILEPVREDAMVTIVRPRGGPNSDRLGHRHRNRYALGQFHHSSRSGSNRAAGAAYFSNCDLSRLVCERTVFQNRLKSGGLKT